jgi:hypothetical protein
MGARVCGLNRGDGCKRRGGKESRVYGWVCDNDERMIMCDTGDHLSIYMIDCLLKRDWHCRKKTRVQFGDNIDICRCEISLIRDCSPSQLNRLSICTAWWLGTSEDCPSNVETPPNHAANNLWGSTPPERKCRREYRHQRLPTEQRTRKRHEFRGIAIAITKRCAVHSVC